MTAIKLPLREQSKMSVKDSLFINNICSNLPLYIFLSKRLEPYNFCKLYIKHPDCPLLLLVGFPVQYNTAVWHYQIYICIDIYICTCAEKKEASAAFSKESLSQVVYCTTFRIYIDRTRHRKCGMKPRPCFCLYLFHDLLSSLLLQLHTKESIPTSALFFSPKNTETVGRRGWREGRMSKSDEQEPTFPENSFQK